MERSIRSEFCGREEGWAKPEIRIPEIRIKSECPNGRNVATLERATCRFGHSSFGFASDFGYSDFGFNQVYSTVVIVVCVTVVLYPPMLLSHSHPSIVPRNSRVALAGTMIDCCFPVLVVPVPV